VSAVDTAKAIIEARLGGYPFLVIDLARDVLRDEDDLTAAHVDWFGGFPDVVILESRVDVDVHTLDDGRTVHVYRTTDDLEGGA
jgi:hypothetical protein